MDAARKCVPFLKEFSNGQVGAADFAFDDSLAHPLFARTAAGLRPGDADILPEHTLGSSTVGRDNNSYTG